MATHTTNGAHPELSFWDRLKGFRIDQPYIPAAPPPAPAPVQRAPVTRRRTLAPRDGETLGQYLKRVRTARDKKQGEMGTLIGTSRSSYQVWENDTRYPPAPALAAIARALGVTVDMLPGPAPTVIAEPEPEPAPVVVPPPTIPAGWLSLQEAAPLYGCTFGKLQAMIYRGTLQGVKGPAKNGQVKWFVPPPAQTPPPKTKADLIAPLPIEDLHAPGTQDISAVLLAWEGRRGWSHKDVAAKSRPLTEVMLIHFAKGTHRANLLVIQELAAVFGVTVKHFLAGPDALPSPPVAPPPPVVTAPPSLPRRPAMFAGWVTEATYAAIVALLAEETPA